MYLASSAQHVPLLPCNHSDIMDEDHYNRKIYCAIQAAMSFRSKALRLPGSLEFAWYELLLLFLSKALLRYQTLSFSPQYAVCKADREEGHKGRLVTRIPDFVILRSLSDIVNGQFSYDSRFILSVAEVKPIKFTWLQSQSMEEVKKLAALTFLDAQQQARVQAKFVFANSIQQCVFAMHVVGPFWNYAVYERDALSPFQPGVDDVAYVKAFRVARRRGNVTDTVRIGTSESDALFQSMLTEMRAILNIGDLPF